MDIIDDKENYWIKYYDSINNGYNQCMGGLGCSGYKHTEDEIKKMRQVQNPKSVIQLNKNGELIRYWDSASMAAKELNISARGIKSCCEQKRYVKSIGGFIWIYKEDENIIDMSYYLKDDKLNTKKIIQYDIDMNVIKIWDSIKEACEKECLCRASVRKVSNGEWKQYKGFIWKIIEN